MKVIAQLVLGFSAVIVLMVGLGGTSLFQVSVENAHVAAMRDQWLPAVRSSLEMQSRLRFLRLGEYRAIGARTPADTQDAEARIKSGISASAIAAASYEKLTTPPEEKAAFADIQKLMPQY
jgi:methyl-accepting chemotaxis protein